MKNYSIKRKRRFEYLNAPSRMFLVIVATLAISSLFLSCHPQNSSSSTITESTTHSNYVTYKDEYGYFTISFPEDWKIALTTSDSTDPEKVQALTKILPLDTGGLVFVSGLPVDYGYNPYLFIKIISNDAFGKTDIYNVADDKFINGTYSQIISRENTYVNNKEAVIILIKSTLSNGSGATLPIYDYVMITQSASYYWMVQCSSWYGNDFNGYSDTFNAVVRSFRGLK